MKAIENIIYNIPNGYSKVIYNDSSYGITKTVFNNGKSIKLYAEELGGTDFISGNFYKTSEAFIVKPCEMPHEKVLSFLIQMKPKE